MKWHIPRYLILFIYILFTSNFSYADTVSSATVTNSTEVVAPAATVSATPAPITKTTVTKSTTIVVVSDTDARIIAAIYSKYAKDTVLIGTKLTVNCVNGDVTITGPVTMQSQEDEAVQVAKSIAGVKSVVSTIDVTTHRPTTQPAESKKY